MSDRRKAIRARLDAYRSDQAAFRSGAIGRGTFNTLGRIYLGTAPNDIDYLLAGLDEAERTVTIDDAEMAAAAVENQRLRAVVDAARAWDAIRTSTDTGRGDVDDAAANLSAALDALDRGEAGC